MSEELFSARNLIFLTHATAQAELSEDLRVQRGVTMATAALSARVIPFCQSAAAALWTLGMVGAAASSSQPALKSALTYGRLIPRADQRPAAEAESMLASLAAPLEVTIAFACGYKLPRLYHEWLFISFYVAVPTNMSLHSLLTALQRLPSVPKSWFTAFYALGLVIAALAIAAGLDAGYSRIHLLPLAVYTLHLVRRLGECLFVHRWSSSARMPLHLWLAGMGHYLLVPWTLLPQCLSAAIQKWSERVANLTAAAAAANATNATSNNAALAAAAAASPRPIPLGFIVPSFLTSVDARYLIGGGLALALWANAQQHVCHRILAGLRKGRANSSTTKDDESSDNSAAAQNNETSSLDSKKGNSGSSTSGLRRRRGGKEEAAAATQKQEQQSSGTTAVPNTSDATAGRHSLPSEGLFRWIVCPHYTAEIVLYAALILVHYGAIALEGAEGLPRCSFVVDGSAAAAGSSSSSSSSSSSGGSGSIFGTFLAELSGMGPLLLAAWVAANLAATANHTKEWYLAQFPAQADAIRKRGAIIPGVG